MKMADAMFCWNPRSDQVAVVSHPDRERKSAPYRMTTGACFASWRKLPHEAMLAAMFIEFHTMVVRDGIDPQAAHKAFLHIDEYRKHIAPDVSGADP